MKSSTSVTAAPVAQITRYRDWLARERAHSFATYDDLWQWSVSDLRGFWQSIWDYFAIESPTPHASVLAEAKMPGAQWFPGAQLNYARQVFRHADAAHAAGHPAIVFCDEAMLAAGRCEETSWVTLRARVAALAAHFKRLGVQRGDRIVAFLPNTPYTAVAFLACASVGAVWSVCSPDMGPQAVLDRWRQIEPKVLITCERYRFGGVEHDRRAVVQQIIDGLPTLAHMIRDDALNAICNGEPNAVLQPEWLPFDHPLWIVYSSGTTGLPKAIVHGHGGIILEALKGGVLHNNVGPTVDTGDRFHWYSATGWIMWNCQVGALLGGTTICLFNGSPGGPSAAPDWTTLWRFAALTRTTFFGAGAAFYASCLKADVRPTHAADLRALRAVGSTGSPLSDECYDWLWQRLPKVQGRDIWIAAISGGTDFAGAFVAGNITLPQVRGQMQCRCLGAAVEAWSEPDARGRGAPRMDEVGELVCVQPMPSMPLYFWNDPDGRRLYDSYFDMYPGIWRHGDWIRLIPHPEAGACGAVIYGRSDATINRHGIRMGTAEFYRAVEALPEVLDSLVVDLEYLGRESALLLFVVLRDGLVLDDALATRIKQALKAALSARHVPNDVIQVSAVPRTLSGKKMELPVKKLLLGQDAAKVLNRDAMANAASVDWFVDFARRRAAG